MKTTSTALSQITVLLLITVCLGVGFSGLGGFVLVGFYQNCLGQ